MSSVRLQKTIESAAEAVRRFPLPMLAAMIIVGATMVWTEDIRWYLIPSLGFPALIASALFSERYEISATVRFLISLVPVPLLILYFFALPESDLNFADGLRYSLFAIAALLAMLAAPFIAPRTTASFHRFATSIILRILLASLFTGLLFAGLALALVAIEKLFNVDVDPEAYAKLFVALVGFVAVPFLLTSIERDPNIESSEIPKALRILTQYVLMPVLVIYALILCAHAVQQIMNWEWSEGWVARLVVGYAASGLLTFAILWPLRNDPENHWVRIFTKWFSILLPPLAFLLFVAVMRRVSEYGVTEARYFGLVIAVWLAGVASYLLFSRKGDLRSIALSLAVIALGTSFGPWGATSVAIRSQVGQLEDALESAGVLKSGRFVSPPPPFEEAAIGGRSMYSLVGFLEDRNALEYLRPWFEHPPDTISERDVMVAIGSLVDGPGNYAAEPARTDHHAITIYGPDNLAVNVSGYDYYVPVPALPATVPVSGDSLTMRRDQGKLHLFLRGRLLLTVDMLGKSMELYRSHRARQESPATTAAPESVFLSRDEMGQLTADVTDQRSGYRARVVLQEVSLSLSGASSTIEQLKGYVLVGRESK